MSRRTRAGDEGTEPLGRPPRGRRRPADGRGFPIVKVFHRPDEPRHLTALGWRARARGTPAFFLHAAPALRPWRHDRRGKGR